MAGAAIFAAGMPASVTGRGGIMKRKRHILIATGEIDGNFSSAQKGWRYFRARGAGVVYVEYSGHGHVYLPSPDTLKWFRAIAAASNPKARESLVEDLQTEAKRCQAIVEPVEQRLALRRLWRSAAYNYLPPADRAAVEASIRNNAKRPELANYLADRKWFDQMVAAEIDSITTRGNNGTQMCRQALAYYQAAARARTTHFRDRAWLACERVRDLYEFRRQRDASYGNPTRDRLSVEYHALFDKSKRNRGTLNPAEFKRVKELDVQLQRYRNDQGPAGPSVLPEAELRKLKSEAARAIQRGIAAPQPYAGLGW